MCFAICSVHTVHATTRFNAANEEKWNNTKWMDMIWIVLSFSLSMCVFFSQFDYIFLSIHRSTFFPLNSMQYFIPFSNHFSTICIGYISKEGTRELLKWLCTADESHRKALYLCPSGISHSGIFCCIVSNLVWIVSETGCELISN